jgi:hypothetical protein
VVFRLWLSASVYNLWREKKNIRNGNHVQTEEKIIRRFDGKLECELCLKADIKKVERMKSYARTGVYRIVFLEFRNFIVSVFSLIV